MHHRLDQRVVGRVAALAPNEMLCRIADHIAA